MKCDQCAKETTEGVSLDWIGGSVASQSTYGAPLGPGTVTETNYDNFTPIPTFLCAACYEPRAKKARRKVGIAALFGLVGIGLLVLAYILLVSAFEILLPVFWRNILGWLAVLGGFLLLKLAWSELSLRMGKIGAPMELIDVFHSYAIKKAREIGRDFVWDTETFKSISRGNERMNEHERLLSLWEKGFITEDEYQEKVKQLYGG
mgnify:CR=1 FL=1